MAPRLPRSKQGPARAERCMFRQQVPALPEMVYIAHSITLLITDGANCCHAQILLVALHTQLQGDTRTATHMYQEVYVMHLIVPVFVDQCPDCALSPIRSSS